MGRAASIALLGACLLGCAGLGNEPTAPPVELPPPVPLQLPAPEAPTAQGPQTVGVAQLPPGFEERLDNIGARLQGVTDAETFASVWTDANRLSRELATELEKRKVLCRDTDYTPLEERYAWLKLTCEAEGTVPFVLFPEQAWGERALATPSPADEAFLALMDSAWDGARAGSWPRWVEQMNDVSGCSRLGEGLILDLLKQTDAADAAFAAPVAELRAALLRDLSPSHMPYCGPSGPRPDAELAAEAQRILQEVRLTEAERAEVEAHVQAGLKGEAFSGG